MYNLLKVMRSQEMGGRISAKEQERMWDIAAIAEQEAVILKIEEVDMPDAKRERDKAMKANMKPRAIILRDRERADIRIEHLMLRQMEAESYVYNFFQGEEDLAEFKRWLERQRAKLDQKLAKAEEPGRQEDSESSEEEEEEEDLDVEGLLLHPRLEGHHILSAGLCEAGPPHSCREYLKARTEAETEHFLLWEKWSVNNPQLQGEFVCPLEDYENFLCAALKRLRELTTTVQHHQANASLSDGTAQPAS